MIVMMVMMMMMMMMMMIGGAERRLSSGRRLEWSEMLSALQLRLLLYASRVCSGRCETDNKGRTRRVDFRELIVLVVGGLTSLTRISC